MSFIHLDDAAAATVAALELGWAPAYASWREGFATAYGTETKS
jgi:hypothetical protein